MITLPVFTYDKDVDNYHIPPSAPLAVIRPRCKVSWITQGHRLGLKENVKRGKESIIKAVLVVGWTLNQSAASITQFILICSVIFIYVPPFYLVIWTDTRVCICSIEDVCLSLALQGLGNMGQIEFFWRDTRAVSVSSVTGINMSNLSQGPHSNIQSEICTKHLFLKHWHAGDLDLEVSRTWNQHVADTEWDSLDQTSAKRQR